MLARDGHDVTLVTVLSDDSRGPEIRSLLPDVTVVAGSSGAPTPVKTRVRVVDHALVRIDEGCGTPPVPDVTDAMTAALDGVDAVVVADYGRGVAAVPAPSVSAGDPCGAGDRLAAGVAVALAGGADVPDAVSAGVVAASEYLAAGGVAALFADVGAAPLPVPGADRDALRTVHDVRSAGGTVVATGGCFDLLHAGHARTLSAARALGDCLVVCLNSDSSVRALKGPDRPIMTQDDRVELLLALDCVDAVVVFDEHTPDEALRRFRPDVWAKGGDYTASELPEAETLAEWGGRVVTVPFHPGRSTTRLAAALEHVG
jgi:rfaE bifunctional protein nucleotidyltransferase chain/domain